MHHRIADRCQHTLYHTQLYRPRKPLFSISGHGSESRIGIREIVGHGSINYLNKDYASMTASTGSNIGLRTRA